MIQEALFELPVDAPPSEPPTLVAQAELGTCCKNGCNEPATRTSPSGNVYCENCGKCGGTRVRETALGISVEICGKSVEQFVLHPRLGYVCPCILAFEKAIEEKK